MSNMVYLLWFKREGLDEADIFVGAYSSEAQAKAAIERLQNKNGFADFPQGFEIYPRELDHDSWVEGFKYVE
jgi:homoserine kinase type II